MSAKAAPRSDGEWSAQGHQFHDKPSDVPSPDGGLRLRYIEPDGLFLIGKNKIELPGNFSTKFVTEVLWAQNSQAFVVTGSEDGGIWNWRAVLYRIDDKGRPVAKDLQPLLAPRMRNFARCGNGHQDLPNFGAVAWINGDKELLILAQVPDSGACSNMTDLEGFRIDVVNWKVLEKLSEKKLRHDWRPYLGTVFRQ